MFPFPHSDNRNRRNLWAASLLLLAPLAVGAEPSLTFVSWGGAYTRSQMLAFVQPFEKQYDMEINVLDYNGGLDELHRQSRSLNVKWDVIDMEPSDALRGCREGLLLTIDPKMLTAASDGSMNFLSSMKSPR